MPSWSRIVRLFTLFTTRMIICVYVITQAITFSLSSLFPRSMNRQQFRTFLSGNSQALLYAPKLCFPALFLGLSPPAWIKVNFWARWRSVSLSVEAQETLCGPAWYFFLFAVDFLGKGDPLIDLRRHDFLDVAPVNPPC